jgi:predicted DCC family thiol-disulfide oxidoreductase YuxK
MKFLRDIFSLDLRSLAVFRIGLALVILGDVIVRAMDLSAHYTDSGVLPRGALLENFGNVWHWSLYFMSGTAPFQALLMGLACLFAGLLLLGYKTRLMTVLSWIFLISIQSRNPMVLQGGDMLLHMLVFWSMFLPLGAYYSVDSALDDSGQKKPKQIFSMGTLALYVQFLLFYWCSVMYKTGYEWWGDGTAVYYALNADHHATAFGHFLLEYASPLLLKALTYFTLLIEILGPAFLIFTRISGKPRLFVILLFIGMHFGFSSALELGIFPWISSVYMLAFLPVWIWDSYEKKLKKKPLKIYYDGDCGFCKKMVYLLKTFLLLIGSTAEPAQEKPAIHRLMKRHHSWVILDDRKKTYMKFEAFTVLVQRSPLFWPLSFFLKWKSVQKLGKKWYEKVAAHRSIPGRFTRKLSFAPVRWKSGKIGSILAGFFILYVICWNLGDIKKDIIRVSEGMTWIGHTLRIDQQWNMFSPHPMKDDGWFVIPGKLLNGMEIDLFTGNFPPIYTKPELISAMYENFRWDKYMRNISSRDLEKHRLYYGQYLCRSWNTRHEGQNRLETFQIIFMKEVTQPDYLPSEAVREVLWTHECFKEPV